jgi:hypothetical protein
MQYSKNPDAERGGLRLRVRLAAVHCKGNMPATWNWPSDAHMSDFRVSISDEWSGAAPTGYAQTLITVSAYLTSVSEYSVLA